MRHRTLSKESLRAAALKSVRRPFLFTAILCCLLPVAAHAQEEATKSVKTFKLGSTDVNVNIYERAGAAVTLFSPHHDEVGARKAALEAVAAHGGRFVEIVSLDGNNNPSRYLHPRIGGVTREIDPNRIYTDHGRKCLKLPTADEASVKTFANELLTLLFKPSGTSLSKGETFFVAIHNNSDVEGRGVNRNTNLSAINYVKPLDSRPLFSGWYAAQAAGVYLSNEEKDEDNYILVTKLSLFDPFAKRGFNVILQKPAEQLHSSDCKGDNEDERDRADDGSLSIYAALNNILYVNLEADKDSGAKRQRQMLEAVYDFIKTGQ